MVSEHWRGSGVAGSVTKYQFNKPGLLALCNHVKIIYFPLGEGFLQHLGFLGILPSGWVKPQVEKKLCSSNVPVHAALPRALTGCSLHVKPSPGIEQHLMAQQEDQFQTEATKSWGIHLLLLLASCSAEISWNILTRLFLSLWTRHWAFCLIRGKAASVGLKQAWKKVGNDIVSVVSLVFFVLFFTRWLASLTEGQDKSVRLYVEFLDGLGRHLTLSNIYSIHKMDIYMLAGFILAQRQKS